MAKEFSSLDLDRLSQEYRDSELNLAQFARRHGVPYMLIKEHLKKLGVTDVLNGNSSGERGLLVEEFHLSQLSVESFSKKRGVSKEALRAWLQEEESRGKKRFVSQWESLVSEFFESDFLTMNVFASHQEISADRFKYWLNKFDPEKKWKRHGETVKKRIVKEFAQTTLSAPAFARRKNINEQTFGFWLRQFDPERKLPNRKAHLILNHEEQRKLVSEFLESGDRAKDFAAKKGINKNTFATWVGNCRNRHSEA